MSEPRRVLELGPLDLWHLGDAACLMPRFDPDWPPLLRSLYHRRLMANLTGRCSCGASQDLSPAIAQARATGELGSVTLKHGPDCLLDDKTFGAMLERASA